MSERTILDPSRISPAAAKKAAQFHADVVKEVEATVQRDAVVVVGMAQNPHVRKCSCGGG
jgi:hypothetical protein